MFDLEELLFDAGKVLTLLSKVRIVEEQEITFQKSSIIIFPWPLFHDKNKKMIDYLKSQNVEITDTVFLEGIKVGYKDYETLTKIYLNLDGVRFLRNYIKLFRIEKIINTSKDMEISIAYDSERTEENVFPKTSNDDKSIIELSKRSDILFVFRSRNSEWIEKIQGYLGSFLFSELKWLENHPFTCKTRDLVVSKKISNGTRSDRIIVNDIVKLNQIINITIKNVNLFVHQSEWSDKLKELTIEYYKSRH